MPEHVDWPKTARFYRDIIVTEKIDGTNAAVVIEDAGIDGRDGIGQDIDEVAVIGIDEENGCRDYVVSAQSRKRIITPDADNYGFARWVGENARTLVTDLGPGRHFGEWWGQGIQRKYGMDHKVFSLFNTSKWGGETFETRDLMTVPVLYDGPWYERNGLFGHSVFPAIEGTLDSLGRHGSRAAMAFGVEFYNAEGICIFHTAANTIFKVTLQDDEAPKSMSGS